MAGVRLSSEQSCRLPPPEFPGVVCFVVRSPTHDVLSSCLATRDFTPRAGVADEPAVNAPRNDNVLLGALVTVTDLLVTDIETRALMERMVHVAAAALPEVSAASVTVPGGTAAFTLAASGPPALRVDEAQYAANDGPCLHALRTGEEVHVADFGTAVWTATAAAAGQQGLHASLSVPMRNGEHVGVLNLYAGVAGAFAGEASRADARAFARYAATVVAAHTRFARAVTEVQQLREALESRAVIEQAKGMIMLQERCTADEAFQILVRTSQHSHLKLRDIAGTLVEGVLSEGERPSRKGS